MTRAVVIDASCLIDLHKGQLLGVVCDLPCRLAIPLPVRDSEALSLSETEWVDERTSTEAEVRTDDNAAYAGVRRIHESICHGKERREERRAPNRSGPC